MCVYICKRNDSSKDRRRLGTKAVNALFISASLVAHFIAVSLSVFVQYRKNNKCEMFAQPHTCTLLEPRTVQLWPGFDCELL